MHILGTCEYMCTKYEVSMSNLVARKGVHRCNEANDDANDDDARRTKDDCIRPFGWETKWAKKTTLE